MTDHMKYLPGMQDIGDDIMSKVLNLRENYDENSYTKTDVFNALNKKIRTIEDFGALLSPAAGNFLEEIARVSQAETRAHFGNNISLFTPLYIANYCDNHCIYCGFNVKNKIERAKLSEEEIRNEMKEIKKAAWKIF